jgi:acetyl-CoA synthetase
MKSIETRTIIYGFWVEWMVNVDLNTTLILIDVINVAGHRLSTSEIESALILNPHCAEAAAVGIPDEITGQAVACFCTTKGSLVDEKSQIQALIQQVRSHIGPFAAPKYIILVSDLPKTRSGKIMRRILRKIAGKDITLDQWKQQGDQNVLGDMSTLADSNVIEHLLEKVHVSLQ